MPSEGKGRRAILGAADIGIIGLGVMGRNLALNVAGHGFGVALYDAWPGARRAFADESGNESEGIALSDSLAEFVAALSRPRAILLLVKAGGPVDDQIENLLPLLEPGDLVIDAGNAHYEESERRGAALAGLGLGFLGMGLSGGAAGARAGPCLMAGGAPEAYGRVEGLLTTIAAQVEGAPCCALLGGAGAGHFVKMLHNGIEYAVMQLIAETYWLMGEALGLRPHEMAAQFARWNRGDLAGYLVEITARVLRAEDPATGLPMVEVIADQAGEKGTGRWAAAAALDLGVPAPTLVEAVSARALSMLKAERVLAKDRLGAGAPMGSPELPADVLAGLEQALLASTICAYAQGFAVMAAASKQHDWQLDLRGVARIWRGGSILSAALLEPMAAAYESDPALANLMMAPELAALLARCQEGWRGTVVLAVTRGLPVPALASALAYFDAYRSDRLWANLIQAQRDCFGAHGFARTDRPGVFHGDWPSSEGGTEGG